MYDLNTLFAQIEQRMKEVESSSKLSDLPLIETPVILAIFPQPNEFLTAENVARSGKSVLQVALHMAFLFGFQQAHWNYIDDETLQLLKRTEELLRPKN